MLFVVCYATECKHWTIGYGGRQSTQCKRHMSYKFEDSMAIWIDDGSAYGALWVAGGKDKQAKSGK